MTRLYYLMIIFLIISYVLIIPPFSFIITKYYKQEELTNNFYQNIFGIGQLKLISKTNSWLFILKKTFYYLLIFLIMITIIRFQGNNWQETKQNIWIIISILFSLYIIPYIILLLILFKKIKNRPVDNQEAIKSLKIFIENWEKEDQKIQKEILAKDNFKKNFYRKEKILNLYLKWIKLIIYLDKRKDPMNYSNSDWNKYLYLFSSYLIANYWIFKKQLKTNDQITTEKIKLIINYFLNNSL